MNALRRSRLARAAAAVAAALVLLLPAAPAHAAGSFTFSNPKASSQYNVSVKFSIDLDASEAPGSVELRLTTPGATGPTVIPLTTETAAGSTTLRYTLVTAGGDFITPNTPITTTWVVHPADGSAPVRSDPSTFLYEDDTQSWRTYSDGIVRVHWTEGSQSFAKQAAATANKALDEMAAKLGVEESEPLDFFIYADDASFRAALPPSSRQNVGGSAFTEIRTLIAEFTPGNESDPWVGITITHELVHQVIDDATSNPYRSLPRWLNEGTAVYESEGNTGYYKNKLQDAIDNGEWWSLTALNWQFPTDYDKTILGYAEGVSAVDYLVKTWGADALTKLILAYRTGPTDDEAIKSVTGKDMAGFQEAWYASLGQSAPSPLGPQPAPAGPVPADWGGSGATPAPGSSNAAPSAGSTPAPGSTAKPFASGGSGAGSSGSGASGGGDDLTLVLAGMVVVAAAVLAGILVAGRKAAAP